MPKFQYNGYNSAGKAVKGTADAMDDHQLYLKLQETGIFATTIEPVQQRSGHQRLKLPAVVSFCTQMVVAAETSGSLDQTLARMGGYFEKDHRMNQKISGAMTYPMILGLLTLAAVVIIVTFVIPQFGSLFETGSELPLPTRVVMNASEFMSHYWYIAIAASAVFVPQFQAFMRLPQVAYEMDEFKIRFKPIRRLMRTIYTARFARTLSSLYSSGMPV